MSLEKIIEHIEEDAQKQIDEIKAQASEASQKIIQEAKKQAESYRAKALEDAQKEAEQHKQRIISTANLEFRKNILAVKQEAIDMAFQEAVNSLVNMKDQDYLNLLKNMILENVQTGEEEIILSERDKQRLGDDLLKQVNSQLAKDKKKGKLTLSKNTYNILGGFVLRRGNIELNDSFESLFNSFREDLESEVSKVLFPEG